MNSNQGKIIRMVVILALVLLIVGGVTRMKKKDPDSMTLEEYASRQAEQQGAGSDTPNPGTQSFGGTSPASESSPGANASSAASSGSEANPTASSGSGGTDLSGATSSQTASSSSETDPAAVLASHLVGASLNRDIPLEEVTVYTEGFYFAPLSDDLKRYITGVSYPADEPEDPAVTYEDLRYVHIWHYNFEGEPVEGELICNEAIAQDLLEIFYELYYRQYQIEKVSLIDAYDGDDTASMEDNNTSCFNYRLVEGSSSLSKHALGLAIDINPYYNPYITYNQDGSIRVSPEDSAAYADRSVTFPYKIDEADLCYRLFTEHGFIWGGNWNSVKDYQHFQKTP